MGSYFGLEIKNYDVISGKSYLSPDIGILFSESEKVREIDKEDEFEKHMYVSTAGKLLERLSVIGITPESSRKDSILQKTDYITEHTDEGKFWGDAAVRKLSFKKWCSTMKEIIENPTFYCRWNVREQSNEAYKYILESEDFLYGFPTDDIRKTLSVILSLFPRDEKVVLDLSALVHGGYYEEDTNFVQVSRSLLVEEKYFNENIIILTEGTYDSRILRETLSLLFSDMIDYFSFLDFESSKAPGGAGQLVNYIKALSGAKITDKIIAIFDNDSAAWDALRTLPTGTLPKNIRFTTYPNYSYLNSYPTIGPSGRRILNINRRAASIELYSGDDILRKKEGAFPIQWTGYVKSIQAYQGEIIEKCRVQEEFSAKISRCKCDASQIGTYDWTGIRAVWNHLFAICKDFSI
jgi:hypothetical protein